MLRVTEVEAKRLEQNRRESRVSFWSMGHSSTLPMFSSSSRSMPTERLSSDGSCNSPRWNSLNWKEFHLRHGEEVDWTSVDSRDRECEIHTMDTKKKNWC